MGLCYYCLRDYKAAINAFDKAIEINPVIKKDFQELNNKNGE